jgi:hypothetical protein
MKTIELNQQEMRETNGGLSIRQAPPRDGDTQTYFPASEPASYQDMPVDGDAPTIAVPYNGDQQASAAY